MRKRMELQDEFGQVWIALEHGHNADGEQYPGLNGRIPAITGLIEGEEVEFCLGHPRGTRVNFCYKKTWWHITQGDQIERKGQHPNFYPEVARAKRSGRTIELAVRN